MKCWCFAWSVLVKGRSKPEPKSAESFVCAGSVPGVHECRSWGEIKARKPFFKFRELLARVKSDL